MSGKKSKSALNAKRKKKYKSPAQRWRDKLDKLWKAAVKKDVVEFYGSDICEVHKAKNCTGKGYDTHHVLHKKRYVSVRHIRTCGVRVCRACHARCENNYNEDSRQALVKRIGEKAYQELYELAQRSEPYTIIELEQIERDLK